MPITQTINPTNDPNYLGSSKEPDKIKGNTAAGGLVGAIGDLFGEGASAVDRGISDIWKDEARAKVTAKIEEHTEGITAAEVPAIAGKYGKKVGGAATVAGDDIAGQGEFVPAQVQGKLDGLNRLKSAVDQGTRSQAYFDTEVAAIAKNLKANYPGYEDNIDRYVSGLLGTSSANDQRKSLVNALAAQEAGAGGAQKRLENQYHADAKYLGARNVSLEQYMAKPQYWQNEVAKMKGRDYVSEVEKNDITLNKDRREIASGRMVQNFNNDLDNKLGVMLQGTLDRAMKSSTIAGDPNSGQTQIDVKDLNLAIASYENTAKAMATTKIGQGADTPASIINDPAKVSAAIEFRVSQLKGLRDQIVNKDYGSAHAAARQIIHGTELRQVEFLKQVPAAWWLKAATNGMDPAVSSAIVQASSKAVTGIANAINESSVMAVTDPSALKVPPSFDQIRAAHKKFPGDKVSGTVTRDLADKLSAVIGLKDKPEASARAVQSLYDPTFFGKLRINEQEDVLKLWGNPTRTAKIKEIADQGHPEVFEQYSQFMTKGWLATNSTRFNDWKTTIGSYSSPYEYSWDAKNAQVVYTPKKGQEERANADDGPRRMERQTVYKMNEQLRTLAPIFTAQGKDVATETARVLQGLNITPGETQESPFGKVLDAVSNWSSAFQQDQKDKLEAMKDRSKKRAEENFR